MAKENPGIVFHSVQTMFQAWSKDMSFSVLNSPYHTVLSPLLWFGRFSGMCYLTPTTAKSGKFWSACLRVYCFLVFCILLAAFIRFITFFQLDGKEVTAELFLNSASLMKMLLVTYGVLCVVSYFFLMIVQKRLNTFFLTLKTQRLFKEVPYKHYLRNISIFMVLAIIVKSAVHVAIVLMATTHTVHLPFTPTIVPGRTELYWVFSIVAFYFQVSIMYAIALLSMLCAIVITNIKALCSQMKENKEPIPVYQKRYQSMVDFAREIDNNYRLFVAINYVLILPMIMFTMFDIVRGKDMDASNVIIFLIWSTMLCFDLLLMSIPAICLFEEGLKPLDVLYAIHNKADGIPTKENMLQVHVFALQISTANVGITAAGFFTITRPLILTIASALITYFVIIIQFATCTPTATTCNCQCSTPLNNYTFIS